MRSFGVRLGGSTQDEVLFAGQTDYLLGGSLVVRDGSIDKVHLSVQCVQVLISHGCCV